MRGDIPPAFPRIPPLPPTQVRISVFMLHVHLHLVSPCTYCTQERWDLDLVLKHDLLNSLYLLEHIINFGFSATILLTPYSSLVSSAGRLFPEAHVEGEAFLLLRLHPDERYLVLGITGQHRLANRSPDLSRTLDASFQYSTSNPCGVRPR